MQILALWNVFACWRAIRERSTWRVNPYTVLACSSAYPLYALCSEHTGPENPAVHFHRQSGLESLTVPSYLVRGTAHAPVYSVRRLRVHRIPNLTSRDYPPLGPEHRRAAITYSQQAEHSQPSLCLANNMPSPSVAQVSLLAFFVSLAVRDRQFAVSRLLSASP